MTDLKARFDELAAAWEAHRLTVIFSSNLRDYVATPAYRDLVALGRPAVPLIMERYREDELPWELVLQEITGEKMIEDMSAYSPDLVKEKWFAWWERSRASFEK